MPKISKRIYDFNESINDFMIHCTNKDLTKKTMKSYEGTLKLFAKYLADEVNIFTLLKVATKHCNITTSYGYRNENKQNIES